MNLPQEYAINDLYLASYLRARGLRLVSIQREGRRSCFIFQDRPERNSMVSDFYDNVPIGINAFIHALEDLKGAIHNWHGVPRPGSGAVR